MKQSTPLCHCASYWRNDRRRNDEAIHYPHYYGLPRLSPRNDSSFCPSLRGRLKGGRSNPLPSLLWIATAIASQWLLLCLAQWLLLYQKNCICYQKSSFINIYLWPTKPLLYLHSCRLQCINIHTDRTRHILGRIYCRIW